MKLLICITLLFVLSIYFICSDNNVENFRVYSAGTRVCNNRGCDIRLVEDKGTYYCPKKNYEELKDNNFMPVLPDNNINFSLE